MPDGKLLKFCVFFFPRRPLPICNIKIIEPKFLDVEEVFASKHNYLYNIAC